MGLLQKIVGAAAKPAIGAIGDVMGKVFQNNQEKLSHDEVMARLAQDPQSWQADINKIEAASRSPFVAGWRPFIGWVCGIGLAFAFIVNPLIQWATGHPGPTLPLQSIMTLVVSLLGLAGFRTVEKVQGVTK